MINEDDSSSADLAQYGCRIPANDGSNSSFNAMRLLPQRFKQWRKNKNRKKKEKSETTNENT